MNPGIERTKGGLCVEKGGAGKNFESPPTSAKKDGLDGPSEKPPPPFNGVKSKRR